jgi:arylsulfatase A-like enzyme
MKHSRSLAALATAALTGTLLMTGPATGAAPVPAKPRPADRVLVVLFDQMLPKYADDFAMPNFRRLRGAGTSFPQAYLGYMASETVIAHNVITSGLQPRHMGYTDEAYRDTNDVFGKGLNAMHITGDLSLGDFATIEKNGGAPYPKLADYLHAARPGGKFITVGEKSYAVESATGASGDIAVRLSSRRTNVTGNYPTGCRNLSLPGATDKGFWRSPAGKNVPSYLTLPDRKNPTLCGRYFINSDKGNDYGTKAAFPSFLYPSEGNRFWPGKDPAHLGGDTWVADAALEMMDRETWSGMFVTMGAIDKAGHMWGAQADTAPQDCTTVEGMTHVRCAAENADVQLGRLLKKVDQVDATRGGKTLVVLTADHGAQFAQGPDFHGKTFADASDSNWYYAPANLGVFDAGSGAGLADKKTYSDPSDAVKQLNADGNLQFSYQSTAIESWLVDHSDAKKQQGAQNMLAMPGVIASYWHDGDHFALSGSNAMTASERSWWTAHGQEIVDTMAAPDGPDVIGLEDDRSGYGVVGDHGGAQESVQRVPMVFWTPSMTGGAKAEAFRTTDVMPTILSAMGISTTTPMDGTAHTLNP